MGKLSRAAVYSHAAAAGGGHAAPRHCYICLTHTPEMIRTCSLQKKTQKIKNKKLPSKWLPGRKHLILAETGVEAVLVPPA